MATFILNIDYPAQFAPDAQAYALARSTDATISANASVRTDLQGIFAAVSAQSKPLQDANTLRHCRTSVVLLNVTAANVNQYVQDLVALFNIAPNESSGQLVLHILDALPRVI